MAVYSPDSTVIVRPFARIREGNEVVIGDSERGVFLALPPEALDILDSLAAGSTVGEAGRRYEEKHGDVPDLDDFLGVMTAEGFVAGNADLDEPILDQQHEHGRRSGRTRTVSLNWVSPRISKPLVSVPAMLLYAAVVGVAFWLYLDDPSVMPGTSVLLYPHGRFAELAAITFVVCIGGSFVHELAHAAVARAMGAPVTLGMSNLMYTIVAQTNISGMRMAPKRWLYLAFLSGSIADLVFAALCFLVLDADRHGVLNLGGGTKDLIGAVLLGYLFRVSSQLQFYTRTDFYYVFAVAFNCRNLLSDTERRVKNGFLRLVGKKPPRFDMSGMARRERVGIRVYLFFYLLGRTYAILILATIFLPIQYNVWREFLTYRAGQHTHLSWWDFLIITALTTLWYGTGLFLWVRGLIRAVVRRTPRAEPERRQPIPVAS